MVITTLFILDPNIYGIRVSKCDYSKLLYLCEFWNMLSHHRTVVCLAETFPHRGSRWADSMSEMLEMK